MWPSYCWNGPWEGPDPRPGERGPARARPSEFGRGGIWPGAVEPKKGVGNWRTRGTARQNT